ncbi:MAG: tetratricopeptide repeat protein [Alphaproteobacteria bacterium]|nr:tetratricopeptide repeat protein [Alphaproteobacteria bacterium]
MNADIVHLEHEWARITYLVKDHDAQLSQIDALNKEAAGIVKKYPDRPEPLIWNGIIASEEAATASIFTALGYAKDARALFEKAEQIDPKAIHGAVPMSLGTLYYRVPGFPVGFGDNDKARHYLEQAMALDPDGLDANYFYGDFLIEQGEYQKAKQVLTHALAAPNDPARPIWDAGRRAEVHVLLDKVNGKLASR